MRIAWVFGANGGNFVKTMLRLGKTHDEIRVVNDQIGTPTYTFDLARLLVDMLETDKYGYYHATNEGGYISWYDLHVRYSGRRGILRRLYLSARLNMDSPRQPDRITAGLTGAN